LVSEGSESLKPAKAMDKDYANLSKHTKEISDLIQGIQVLIEKRDLETLKNFEEA
jgi:hypothetical protein